MLSAEACLPTGFARDRAFFFGSKQVSDSYSCGRNPANQLIGSLSYYLQGSIHRRESQVVGLGISEPSTAACQVV